MKTGAFPVRFVHHSRRRTRKSSCRTRIPGPGDCGEGSGESFSGLLFSTFGNHQKNVHIRNEKTFPDATKKRISMLPAETPFGKRGRFIGEGKSCGACGRKIMVPGPRADSPAFRIARNSYRLSRLRNGRICAKRLCVGDRA